MASIKTMGCQPSMKNHRRLKRSEENFANIATVLSISFKVDVPTKKGGGRQLFERQECEIKMVGDDIFNFFQTVFGP